MLQGFGSARLTTAAMVVLADISTPSNRGRIMSLYQGSLLLGAGAGPAIGGIVAGLWGFRAPFLAFGATTLLAALWAVLRVPETGNLTIRRGGEGGAHEHAGPATAGPAVDGLDLVGVAESSSAASTGSPSMLAAVRTLLGNRNFLLVSLLTLMTVFTRTGGQMTLLPLLGATRIGLSEAAIGGVFTLISLVHFSMLYVAGSLSDRFGRKAVIVPSGILSAAAILLFAFTGSVQRPEKK